MKEAEIITRKAEIDCLLRPATLSSKLHACKEEAQ